MKNRVFFVALTIGMLPAWIEAQVAKPKTAPPPSPAVTTTGPRFSAANPGTMNELLALVEKQRKESEKAQSAQSGKPVVHVTMVIEKYFIETTHLAESRPISNETKGIVALWFAVPGRRADAVPNYVNEYRILDGAKEYWLPAHKQVVEWMPTDIKKGDAVLYEIVWLGGLYTPAGSNNAFLLNGFRVK